MKAWMISCCVGVALALPVAAAQKAVEKKAVASKKKAEKKKRRAKLEKLACRLGTEDEHARIAVLLADGKVDSFAYYSKWKPRTCSMEVKRDDAFSKWEDTGTTTVVTLIEEKGAFLIDNGRGRYHFIFRDIDRMRYCGMDGKVNGTLTIYKGRPQCEVTGVMDRETWEPPVAAKPEAGSPDVAAPQAVPDLRKAAAEMAGKQDSPDKAAVIPPAAPDAPAGAPTSPDPAEPAPAAPAPAKAN